MIVFYSLILIEIFVLSSLTLKIILVDLVYYKFIRFMLAGDDIDVDAAINFLEFTRNPWPNVIEKWNWTLQTRLKKLIGREDKDESEENEDDPEYLVSDYFKEWPVLSCASGNTLVSHIIHQWLVPILCNQSQKSVERSKVMDVCLSCLSVPFRASKEIFVCQMLA